MENFFQWSPTQPRDRLSHFLLLICSFFWSKIRSVVGNLGDAADRKVCQTTLISRVVVWI